MAVQRKWLPVLTVVGMGVVLGGMALYRARQARQRDASLEAAAAAIDRGDVPALKKAIASVEPDALYGANGAPALSARIMGDTEIEHGRPLLMMAVRCQRLLDAGQTCAPLVQALIDHGARADISGAYGITPLMAACESSDYPTVKILLDHGARVQARDANGFSALFLSVHNRPTENSRKIVAALLAHGADPNMDTMGGVAIEMTSDYEVVSMLIKGGADVNHSWHTITPLMMAARAGNIKTARLLIAHGARVNAKDARGEDAAAFARLGRHPDMVRFLSTYHAGSVREGNAL